MKLASHTQIEPRRAAQMKSAPHRVAQVPLRGCEDVFDHLRVCVLNATNLSNLYRKYPLRNIFNKIKLKEMHVALSVLMTNLVVYFQLQTHQKDAHASLGAVEKHLFDDGKADHYLSLTACSRGKFHWPGINILYTGGRLSSTVYVILPLVDVRGERLCQRCDIVLLNACKLFQNNLFAL